MPKAKPAPSLGFELDELAGTVAGYEPSAKASAPVKVGRPRSLARDAQPVSVRLDGDQRRWLLEEAARRTLASGTTSRASCASSSTTRAVPRREDGR